MCGIYDGCELRTVSAWDCSSNNVLRAVCIQRLMLYQVFSLAITSY